MGTDTVKNTRGGGSTSEWPFLQTNLFVVTNSTNSFFFASRQLHGGSFSRSLQQRWPLRSGPARCARDVDEQAQLLRFLKSTKCACVKISASVCGILCDAFHLPTLCAQRFAKWLWRMRREDVIAHCGSRLCSEHVDEDCFEARLLLRREVARGDGSYMRKPGRTSKATAIPTGFTHTQSVEWRCGAHCQLGRGEEKSAGVRTYLFVRSWPS